MIRISMPPVMSNPRRFSFPLVPFFQAATGGLFPLIDCEGGPCELKHFEGLIVKVLNILWTLAGTVAVLVVFWGAYQLFTAAGDPTKAESARKTLFAGLIGSIIVAVAYAFTIVFANMVVGGEIEVPKGLQP